MSCHMAFLFTLTHVTGGWNSLSLNTLKGSSAIDLFSDHSAITDLLVNYRQSAIKNESCPMKQCNGGTLILLSYMS